METNDLVKPKDQIPLTVLGIETSCDETAASVVRLAADGSGQILSNVVRSQLDLHAVYGGVPVHGGNCRVQPFRNHWLGYLDLEVVQRARSPRHR